MAKEHFVIVVADDDPAVNEVVHDALCEEGYDVRRCFTGDAAARIIQRVVPDLAIIDMQMEVRDAGLRVLRSLRQDPATARIAVIICSGDSAFLRTQRHELATYGAEIVVKPFDITHLVATVSRLLAAPQP
jgi:CheY-like chemotaxis protein